MLIKLDTLRERLHGVVLNKGEQGHNIEGLQEELDSLSDSYDEFVKFTEKLLNLKIRNDWSYVEPSSINDILNEMDPSRPKGKIKEIDYEDSSKRVEAAFIASLCGCMLGKPLEAMFTGHEIRKALEEIEYFKTNSDGYSFQIEMTIRSIAKGLIIKEVPIIFYERRLGNSKMSKSIVLEALLFLLKNGLKRWLNIKIN